MRVFFKSPLNCIGCTQPNFIIYKMFKHIASKLACFEKKNQSRPGFPQCKDFSLQEAKLCGRGVNTNSIYYAIFS